MDERTRNEVRFLRCKIAYNASYIRWLPNTLDGQILKYLVECVKK
jgi:hypothetical protein